MKSFNHLFKRRNIIFFAGFVILIVLSGFILSRQNNPILGTWIGLHDTYSNNSTKWVFKSNKRLKRYEEGKLYKIYTYVLSKTPNHCGVDMSDRLKHFPKNRILIMKNTETQKKTCALIYKLNKKRLVLSAYWAPAAIDTLKKVQQ